MSEGLWIAIAVIAVLVVAALIIGLVRYRRRQISLRRSSESPTPIDRSGGYSASSGISFTQSSVTTAPPKAPATPPTIDTTGLPGVGDDAALPRDSVKRPIEDVRLPEPPVVAEPPAAAETVPDEPVVDETPAPAAVAPTAPDLSGIAPTEGRLERLRGRLAKSQNALGRSMLGLLGGGDLDEESWEEVEDTLLIADLGPVVTSSVIAQLRSRLAATTVRTEAEARAVLRDVLITELDPGLDRSIKALPHADKPSVLLVVGVNGTGKTTTVGKLARVLVADGRRVVLGAADTFRAAAADQLQSWASRVGAEVVRGPEGADPASVAFDSVDKGIEAGADVVVIDTAGRLHTKTGLMDELGKVKRVVSKRAAVDEVLLVLDATIGQNGLAQARVFAEVVDITGLVLTKLDGTAKGGIVFRVQQELGVPVKLVGLGEGPDDLAPFEPAAFVDALLG
ncbi:signal recognition particle-docking protein FtsY [Mycolicibacterium rhodesiae]|uniref:Signal recognition particle receptor FtsY n=1 Tax=Mycolicibacterium rhodesiae TaxID=36814 RepID=A0A1X0J554_MYCRH|nr:signal recognition particle-docking protein FtsY [Mycolicibacterium rhodesiae]MCV7345738.1 signal recognition particle-docking protein FtsY [Mycolicibacterium rhodesiae]ORB57111.1 signal recognition particle-docking protein FtsY [Mycolicibacterium rhodesiae]